jgi:hypothetical protein
VAGQVLPRRAAVEDPSGTGEEADLVDHRRDLLRERECPRLAGIAALGVDELVGAALQRIRDVQQRPLPVRRRRVAPGLEGLRGRLHGAVDVGVTRDRRLRIGLTGRRIDHVAGAAVGRGNPFTADEVAERLD